MVIPPQAGQDLLTTLEKDNVQVSAAPSGNGFGTTVLIYLITFGLPILLFVWFFRRISRGAAGGLQGALGVGRSRAKVFDEEQPSTTFADVAGYEGAKAEIAEVVDFLKHPDRYTRAGAMVPRGVLMIGPPGTGKTLLARAVAGEAHVPFFSVTGSSFVELFVGVGASRVRDLFQEARKRGTAIIFIDEIDAIGQRRAGSGAVVSNDEREQTLNQLLAEMDGFDPSTGVVVLAATNRPEILDPALLRPGRFDRQVTIPLPNVGRAGRHPGRALPRQEAGPGRGPERHRPRHPRLLRRGPGQPDQRGGHLRGPREPGHPHGRRLRRGQGPDHPGPPGRLERAAAGGEARGGGARVGARAGGRAVRARRPGGQGDDLARPGQALGVTEQLPLVERHMYGEDYLHDSLAVRLGGRAAELVVLGQGSTGAANDLAGATDLATKMVREFGLSETLGPVGYPEGGSVFLGSGGPGMSSRPFAEATQAEIDREVAKLLREAEKRAVELLRGHRSILDALTNLLLEDETVDGSEVYRLAGLPDRSATPPSMAPPTTVAPRAVATADASHQASGS